MTPVRTLRSLQLDFDVHTGSQVELHQSIDCLGCGLDDVEQTLMRPDFELFAALLVDMRRAVHGETLDAGRQRDRSTDLGAGALGRVDDFPRRIVENSMIEGFEPDADVLALHDVILRSRPCYLIILATTPAPTVRPPSRMAKRSFSSI